MPISQSQTLDSKIAAEALKVMAGSKGTYFMEVTTAHTGKFALLQINTDAVFSLLTISNGTRTANALTMQNLATFTVSRGISLTPPDGWYFSAITMSTGTCVGVIE